MSNDATLSADELFQADHDRVLGAYDVPGALYLLAPDSPAWGQGARAVTGEPEFEAEWRRRVAGGVNPDHALAFVPHSH